MAFLDYSGLSRFLDKIKGLFVAGPSSSTDAHVATFDGTTGKKVKDSGYTIAKSVPSNAVFTDNDTKNTAGTTNKTGTKMYIAAATSQNANPQTYSNSNVYIGTDNCLYSNGTKVLTAHQDISGKKNTQSAVSDPSASGTSLTFISGISQNAQGVISPAKKTVTTMGGASSSAAGSIGLVPAPAAGEHKLFLKGDGTWDEPDGVRLYVADLDTVTNTSGSYTHTSTVTGMTGDLKAVLIECSDPTIFKDKVVITTASNSVTLTCSDVSGTSTVKVSFAVQGNANPLNSTEYAALDARIGDLSDLTTSDKSSIVGATNSLNDKLFPSYTTAGLTFNYCTYIAGGYAKIGKLTIINIRVNVTRQTFATTYIAGFPSYSGAKNFIYVVTSAEGVLLARNGDLAMNATQAEDDEMTFFAAYISD